MNKLKYNMENHVADIKSKLDIVEVVKEYVPIQKFGANFKAPCPFHNEKTPSFMVSQDKQIWHCFGCNKGGDIFSFVQEIENIDFIEALRILAKKAGVVLKKIDPKIKNKKNQILNILDLSSKYFAYQLQKNPKAKIAREYLNKRGLNNDIIADINIGFSLEQWDDLLKFLRTRNYTDADILDAGLIIKKDNSFSFYDRFRNRLMFPIFNANGETVGFGARILSNDKTQAKYINSPQTLVYNKSNILYGLNIAKQSIKEKDYCIVVEGYMDVLANFKIGIKNVIATSGTALTSDHVKLIKRYTQNIIFCFDSDQAGQDALRRAVEISLANDINIKVIEISSEYGKDPDECINKDYSKWIEHIKNAKNIFEYYFNKNLDNNLEIKDKSAIIENLLLLISNASNKIEQLHWVEKLSQKSNIDIKLLQERLRNITLNKQYPKYNKNAKNNNIIDTYQPVSQKISVIQKIISLILLYPDYFLEISKQITPDMIDNAEMKALYKNLIIYYTKNNQKIPLSDKGYFEYEYFLSWLAENKIVDDISSLRQFINKLFIFACENFNNLDQKLLQKEFFYLYKIIKNQYIKQQIALISKKINNETDKNIIKDLSQKFNELIRQYIK